MDNNLDSLERLVSGSNTHFPPTYLDQARSAAAMGKFLHLPWEGHHPNTMAAFPTHYPAELEKMEAYNLSMDNKRKRDESNEGGGKKSRHGEESNHGKVELPSILGAKCRCPVCGLEMFQNQLRIHKLSCSEPRHLPPPSHQSHPPQPPQPYYSNNITELCQCECPECEQEIYHHELRAHLLQQHRFPASQEINDNQLVFTKKTYHRCVFCNTGLLFSLTVLTDHVQAYHQIGFDRYRVLYLEPRLGEPHPVSPAPPPPPPDPVVATMNGSSKSDIEEFLGKGIFGNPAAGYFNGAYGSAAAVQPAAKMAEAAINYTANSLQQHAQSLFYNHLYQAQAQAQVPDSRAWGSQAVWDQGVSRHLMDMTGYMTHHHPPAVSNSSSSSSGFTQPAVGSSSSFAPPAAAVGGHSANSFGQPAVGSISSSFAHAAAVGGNNVSFDLSTGNSGGYNSAGIGTNGGHNTFGHAAAGVGHSANHSMYGKSGGMGGKSSGGLVGSKPPVSSSSSGARGMAEKQECLVKCSLCGEEMTLRRVRMHYKLHHATATTSRNQYTFVRHTFFMCFICDRPVTNSEAIIHDHARKSHNLKVVEFWEKCPSEVKILTLKEVEELRKSRAEEGLAATNRPNNTVTPGVGGVAAKPVVAGGPQNLAGKNFPPRMMAPKTRLAAPGIRLAQPGNVTVNKFGPKGVGPMNRGGIILSPGRRLAEDQECMVKCSMCKVIIKHRFLRMHFKSKHGLDSFKEQFTFTRKTYFACFFCQKPILNCPEAIGGHLRQNHSAKAQNFWFHCPKNFKVMTEKEFQELNYKDSVTKGLASLTSQGVISITRIVTPIGETDSPATKKGVNGRRNGGGGNSAGSSKQANKGGQKVLVKKTIIGPGGLARPDQRRYSDCLADLCLSRCMICRVVVPFGHDINHHLQAKHKKELESFIGRKHLLIKTVFHRCKLCSKEYLFSTHHVYMHLKLHHTMQFKEYRQLFLKEDPSGKAVVVDFTKTPSLGDMDKTTINRPPVAPNNRLLLSKPNITITPVNSKKTTAPLAKPLSLAAKVSKPIVPPVRRPPPSYLNSKGSGHHRSTKDLAKQRIWLCSEQEGIADWMPVTATSSLLQHLPVSAKTGISPSSSHQSRPAHQHTSPFAAVKQLQSSPLSIDNAADYDSDNGELDVVEFDDECDEERPGYSNDPHEMCLCRCAHCGEVWSHHLLGKHIRRKHRAAALASAAQRQRARFRAVKMESAIKGEIEIKQEVPEELSTNADSEHVQPSSEEKDDNVDEKEIRGEKKEGDGDNCEKMGEEARDEEISADGQDMERRSFTPDTGVGNEQEFILEKVVNNTSQEETENHEVQHEEDLNNRKKGEETDNGREENWTEEDQGNEEFKRMEVEEEKTMNEIEKENDKIMAMTEDEIINEDFVDEHQESQGEKETVTANIVETLEQKETVTDDIEGTRNGKETVTDKIKETPEQKETVIDDIEDTSEQKETSKDDMDESPHQKVTVTADLDETHHQNDTVTDDTGETSQQKETVSDDLGETLEQKENVADGMDETLQQKETVTDDLWETLDQKENVTGDREENPEMKETITDDDLEEKPEHKETVTDNLEETPLEEESVTDDLEETPDQKENVTDNVGETAQEEEKVTGDLVETSVQKETITDDLEETPLKKQTVTDDIVEAPEQKVTCDFEETPQEIETDNLDETKQKETAADDMEETLKHEELVGYHKKVAPEEKGNVAGYVEESPEKKESHGDNIDVTPEQKVRIVNGLEEIPKEKEETTYTVEETSSHKETLADNMEVASEDNMEVASEDIDTPADKVEVTREQKESRTEKEDSNTKDIEAWTDDLDESNHQIEDTTEMSETPEHTEATIDNLEDIEQQKEGVDLVNNAPEITETEQTINAASQQMGSMANNEVNTGQKGDGEEADQTENVYGLSVHVEDTVKNGQKTLDITEEENESSHQTENNVENFVEQKEADNEMMENSSKDKKSEETVEETTETLTKSLENEAGHLESGMDEHDVTTEESEDFEAMDVAKTAKQNENENKDTEDTSELMETGADELLESSLGQKEPTNNFSDDSHVNIEGGADGVDANSEKMEGGEEEREETLEPMDAVGGDEENMGTASCRDHSEENINEENPIKPVIKEEVKEEKNYNIPLNISPKYEFVRLTLHRCKICFATVLFSLKSINKHLRRHHSYIRLDDYKNEYIGYKAHQTFRESLYRKYFNPDPYNNVLMPSPQIYTLPLLIPSFGAGKMKQEDEESDDKREEVRRAETRSAKRKLDKEKEMAKVVEEDVMTSVEQVSWFDANTWKCRRCTCYITCSLERMETHVASEHGVEGGPGAFERAYTRVGERVEYECQFCSAGILHERRQLEEHMQSHFLTLEEYEKLYITGKQVKSPIALQEDFTPSKSSENGLSSTVSPVTILSSPAQSTEEAVAAGHLHDSNRDGCEEGDPKNTVDDITVAVSEAKREDTCEKGGVGGDEKEEKGSKAEECVEEEWDYSCPFSACEWVTTLQGIQTGAAAWHSFSEHGTTPRALRRQGLLWRKIRKRHQQL